jgi:hypothetical protein
MATTRDALSTELHRLSNYVECRLADLIHELAIESRMAAVHDIAWSGGKFIETLREIRDG